MNLYEFQNQTRCCFTRLTLRDSHLIGSHYLGANLYRRAVVAQPDDVHLGRVGTEESLG